MKTVVITGSNGFIGSHTAKAFRNAGYYVVGIDNQYTIPANKNYCNETRIGDYSEIGGFAVQYHRADAIVHCAANSLVGPSINNPDVYYHNNVSKLNQFLSILRETYKWQGNIIFYSSAEVYGTNNSSPIKENDEKDPISPYGRSKLIGEQIINDHCIAYGFKAIALRYFNATGCDIDGELGCIKNDTHLVPRIATAALTENTLIINGNDYNTPDGTCIRDYLHVTDIANAHLAAVELSMGYTEGDFETFNLGTGNGHSNLELANAFVEHTVTPLTWAFGPRQIGDPDELIADPINFIHETGWMPEYSDLETIVKTTFDFMKKIYYNN
jgi:UDP-arabinose 4-epimerase